MIFFPVIAASTTSLSIEVDPVGLSEEVGSDSGNVGTIDLTITGGVAPYIASWVNTDPGISVTDPTSTTSSMITYTGLASVLDFISDTVSIVVEDAVGQVAFFNVSVFVVRTR